jgi:hypothetical protein
MQKTFIEDDVEVTIEYFRQFDYRNHGGGFHFPCDENGTIDELLSAASDNLRRCQSGELDVIDRGVKQYRHEARLCPCGSQLHPEEVHDARGIFVARVCNNCKHERLSKYRDDIFTDSQYECYEQIEDDY